MPKRMLIDASHPEETRVVVLDGNRVEEFDFEAASKRPLKGNIYLAKVTRVEPSLQAAFVEYGGNRQGFLAFSEIHPDYYQIPVADRIAILEAQTRRMMAEEDFDAVDTARAPTQEPLLGDAHEEAHSDELPPPAGMGDSWGAESDEQPEDSARPSDATGDVAVHEENSGQADSLETASWATEQPAEARREEESFSAQPEDHSGFA